MSCECQSGDRFVGLRWSAKCVTLNPLQQETFGGSWEAGHGDQSAVATVGPTQTWKTLLELCNFFRALLPESQLQELEARWLSPAAAQAACHGCAGSASCAGQAAASYQRLTDMTPTHESPLMDMLQNRRIETWFQPIFHGREMRLWGYECLMRGRTSGGELISPATILDWAREENLIFMLDRICRETHILNAGRADLPPQTNILINFLPTAIYEPAYCLRTTEAAVRQSGLSKDRIIFEVVETDEIHDREHLANIMRYYEDRGYRTALDDVGTGYSGLMMLAELNPYLIKIDRGLIAAANDSKMHRVICSALVQMARESDKLILAEGIETGAQHRLMVDLGVDLFQGFRFGRPSPQPALTALVDRDDWSDEPSRPFAQTVRKIPA